MIYDPCSLERALQVLNELVQADPVAAKALVETRVPCNGALLTHPTIQVVGNTSDGFRVGMLGILNGIFGIEDGWGPIAAVFDVVCSHCQVKDEGDKTPGDPCSLCGSPLELGPLTGFQRTK